MSIETPSSSPPPPPPPHAVNDADAAEKILRKIILLNEERLNLNQFMRYQPLS